MKKSFVMLLTVAALGLGSCNDIQDLNINFGDRTYINDYKGLIDAVNDLNLTLKERFNALSQLLKQGLADIQVSIDANTGAITIVGQNIATLDGDIKDGLSTINTTLFNGFQAVCTQIDATGNTIVAAIDNNGNLLRLQIDATGKLLSAQLITSTEDLIKAMNENNTSLAEKLGLIDAAIKAGFADEKTSLDAVKAAVDALKDKVEAGTLSNKQAIDALTEAIKSQTTSLETKLAAIEEANKAGLATLAEKNDLIDAAIKALADEVKAGNKSNEDALKEIKTAIDNENTSLTSKIELLTAAVNNGLADEKTALEELKAALDNFKNSNETKLAAIITALGDLKKQEADNNKAMSELMEKEAYENGVVLPSDFPKRLYLTPSAYLNMSQEMKNALNNTLATITPSPICEQRQWANYPNGSNTQHSCFKATPKTEGSTKVAGQLVTVGDKQYYEMYKTKEWIKYDISLSSGCTWPYLVKIRVKDAKGLRDIDVYSQSVGITSYEVQLYYIVEEAGKVTVDITPYAHAYCSSTKVTQ